MEKEQNKAGGQSNPSSEAKIERLLRRMFEGMGASLDRRLGRDTINTPASGNLTAHALIARMKRAIDERAVIRAGADGREGRFAPHVLHLKVEWGHHAEAPPEKIKDLEHEILAAAIDHINDNRYRTFAPVRLETTVDIFTTGIAVDPTFGEYAEQLADKKPNEAAAPKHLTKADTSEKRNSADDQIVRVAARVNFPVEGHRDKILDFKMGGRRLSVGRAADADFSLPDASVSKIHAALVMNREGTLLVADTGSTNGTFINGRRIAYGEARQIEEGDVVSFGEIEVRLRKL